MDFFSFYVILLYSPANIFFINYHAISQLNVVKLTFISPYYFSDLVGFSVWKVMGNEWVGGDYTTVVVWLCCDNILFTGGIISSPRFTENSPHPFLV